MLSATALQDQWKNPPYDGGLSLTKYAVEWDTQGDFLSGASKKVELPLVREVQSIVADSAVLNEEQHIRATVQVVN